MTGGDRENRPPVILLHFDRDCQSGKGLSPGGRPGFVPEIPEMAVHHLCLSRPPSYAAQPTKD